MEFKYTSSYMCVNSQRELVEKEKLGRIKRELVAKLVESFVWPSIAMLFTKRTSWPLEMEFTRCQVLIGGP